MNPSRIIMEQTEEWPAIQEPFCRWADFMDQDVQFLLSSSTIHTRSHCLRVLFLALDIAHQTGLGPDSLEILGATSVFHDTRRQDDGRDVGHGLRAASYYQEFCRSRDLAFDERVYLIMALHDRHDTEGEKMLRTKNLQDGLLLYRIFKDADALDRWRLGAKGLDPSYLRTQAARGLIDLARCMVEADQGKI